MTNTTPPDSISIHRRLIVWQVGFFSALLLIEAVVHALSELSDYARLGDPLALWEPFTWEFSSVLVIGALIPLIATVKRRFPIDARSWRLTVPVHLLATVPYSVIHVTGMVALRKLVYAAVGSHFNFGPLLSSWLYEYRKDFVSYWLLLALLYGFTVYRRWLAMQDRPAAVPVSPAPKSNGSVAERLVVRRLNREYILNAGDIEHIEAGGNYAIVHADGTSYRLRESLASLAARLDSRRFVQVHRSHIVNIDYIREIQPWDHGDYRILLKDDSFINFSRRYRSRLAHLFTSPAIDVHQSAARP